MCKLFCASSTLSSHFPWVHAHSIAVFILEKRSTGRANFLSSSRSQLTGKISVNCFCSKFEQINLHLLQGHDPCLGIGIDYKLANLISKLNFYKLIPYPMDNMLNRSAQTSPPNARKRRPVFPLAGQSVVLCTPQMAPRTSFLSRQPDVIASFSLSKPLRPLVS